MNIGITCKQAVDYISKREEQKLSFRQRIQLWRHLAVCSLCKTFAVQNKAIAQMFKNRDHDHQLTDDDKKKIVDFVLGKQQ